jgi:alkanesulfonate monooxygenase SsuD/methylene tetrahydromethanopterin reductase-like flavin-dependent oxidoreductase (luciferase family)
MSPPALRRAVRQGNGWYGFALDPEQTATCVAGLREAEQRVDRPDALGQLELSVTPMGQVDADRCARYAELGVDRLVLLGMARDVPGMVAFIERSAESLLHAG